MKSGELYKICSHVRSGTIRTDDLSTDNMEYFPIGQEVPVMLLEEIKDKRDYARYYGYWKVLVQDQVGWVHRSILITQYQKLNG